MVIPVIGSPSTFTMQGMSKIYFSTLATYTKYLREMTLKKLWDIIHSA